MEQEQRLVIFDADLQIEACQLKGIVQKFPNHFHEHYVLGFIESGSRSLVCKNKAYTVESGHLLLFNPFDSHTCQHIGHQPLDWRCIHIKEDILCKYAYEIAGCTSPPLFHATVVRCEESVALLRELHQMIFENRAAFKKEEALYFLLELLITRYAKWNWSKDVSAEIQKACEYMDVHYHQQLGLADLSQLTGLNKYTLLRNFTKQRGITPYQYLSTVRINRAKQLLEQGVLPLDAALQSGFTDQSHFTRFFKNFIGLTPKRYQDIFHESSNGTGAIL